MSLFDTGPRPLIDAYLLEESKKLRDYGDFWSASSAGYCQRKVIFERLGVPKIESDGDARKTRVFESGKIFHEWVQRITKNAGVSIAQELELQDEELKIRGHIDDLLLIDGKLLLVDYKTQNSRAFSYKRPDMSYYHKMQLGTYMYMLRNGSEKIEPNEHTTQYAAQKIRSRELEWRKFAYPQLTEARILKISKDDLRMNEEQLVWSEQLELDVTEYWINLNSYWKNKRIPPCTCHEHEGGFMANEKWNGYFYDGEPCSIKWYTEWKLNKEESNVKN